MVKQATPKQCAHRWVPPMAGFYNEDTMLWCRDCGCIKYRDEVVSPSYLGRSLAALKANT